MPISNPGRCPAPPGARPGKHAGVAVDWRRGHRRRYPRPAYRRRRSPCRSRKPAHPGARPPGSAVGLTVRTLRSTPCRVVPLGSTFNRSRRRSSRGFEPGPTALAADLDRSRSLGDRGERVLTGPLEVLEADVPHWSGTTQPAARESADCGDVSRNRPPRSVHHPAVGSTRKNRSDRTKRHSEYHFVRCVDTARIPAVRARTPRNVTRRENSSSHPRTRFGAAHGPRIDAIELVAGLRAA